MMKGFLEVLLFFSIFFCFSKGKPCPEDTKPHQSRCDVFFKCVVLPSMSHVWVPTKCERGLVYEPNLRLCVLPDDDWECNAGDQDMEKSDDDNVYGINAFELYPSPKRRESIKISNDTRKVFEQVKNGFDSKNPVQGEKLQSEEIEASGDGSSENDLFEIEVKESEGMELMPESRVDPKLSSQLQRLSQLVDGLKQTYQNKNEPNADLRPDQLNAFLAHYNLRTDFDAISPVHEKQTVPENGKIEPNILREIIEKQERLNSVINHNSHKHIRPSSTHIKISSSTPLKSSSVVKVQPNSELVVTHNGQPKPYRKAESSGYPNSQIVVNRPGGSVLFSLPQYSNMEDKRDEPRISEETLKTVLELSKQMVTNQNFRQVLPNNAYFQPFIQPLYYTVPVAPYQRQQTHSPNDSVKYEKLSSATYFGHYPLDRLPETIIQNSVMPMHVNKQSEWPKKDTQDKISNHHSIDSYGNKLSEYIEYPPYTRTQLGTDNNNFAEDVPQIKITNLEQKFQHTTPSYFTVSPHLDSGNANNVVSIERYPTISYASIPSRYDIVKPQQSQNQLQPPSTQAAQPPIFPHVQPNNVKIRPNSYNSPDSGEQSEDHNHGSVNKEIVSDLLTPNVDQSVSAISSTGTQLVNLGGSFISLDIYKNQILPSISSIGNIEVITCSAAVRQANTSDCTKYYVCSKKDGKVLSYSCPPYTAFNVQARICDAKTYTICHPHALYNRFTVAENRKIQMEALKALQEAKLIRDEAIKAQNLAHLIRLETQKVINNTIIESTDQGLKEPTVLLSNHLSELETLTPNPVASSTPSTPLILYGHKKRKYFCKEGDKVPDQMSVYNYYVCFKTKDGVMKGHKMTCSSGLMFCARTALCTLPQKCSG